MSLAFSCYLVSDLNLEIIKSVKMWTPHDERHSMFSIQKLSSHSCSARSLIYNINSQHAIGLTGIRQKLRFHQNFGDNKDLSSKHEGIFL